MTEVEQFSDDYQLFKEQHICRTPTAAGVFVLADQSRQIIYIGFGTNLNKMLIEVLKMANICTSKAKYFQIAMHPSPLQGAAAIYRSYKEEHSNMIPRCNKFDLSAGR